MQLQREPGNNAKGGGSGVVINCVRELRSVSSKGRRHLHHVGSEEMLFSRWWHCKNSSNEQRVCVFELECATAMQRFMNY